MIPAIQSYTVIIITTVVISIVILFTVIILVCTCLYCKYKQSSKASPDGETVRVSSWGGRWKLSPQNTQLLPLLPKEKEKEEEKKEREEKEREREIGELILFGYFDNTRK